MSEEIRVPLPALADGEMKQVRAGPTDVLLINSGGRLHAVEPTCPHYRQPLSDGLVCNGQLRCSWHQSVFDVATGNVLEPPALTGLKKYPVRVDGDQVIIDVASYRSDRRCFVILGGGAAGYSAAKTLRENGFDGDLTILSADRDAPYDRPNLSKDFLAGKPLDTPLPLADEQFYKDNRIDLRLGCTAQSIDRIEHSVHLTDGFSIPFDKLLIATGARPRTLEVPNNQLPGIHILRSLENAKGLIAAVSIAKHVAVIGGGFIAIEIAAALRQRGVAVTVVTRSALPMQEVFGDEIASMIRKVHEKNGVVFRTGRQVKQFEGVGHLRAITLDDSYVIDCDIAVVAIGVQPNTEFLQSSFGDLINTDGGLQVDHHLSIGENVYAAGDVAHVEFGRRAWNDRIEHWRVAEQLGKIAALNMLGQQQAFDEVPYFWTYQFDVALDYIGHADRWDEIIIDGDVQAQDFVACYVIDDQVVAACVSSRPAQACAMMELFKREQFPPPSALRARAFDYVEALSKLSLPSTTSPLG